MTGPAQLKNLGPRSTEWLAEIGVVTLADIERLGSVEIYRRLKLNGRPASLNLLWALEAAMLDVDWRELPEDLKAELRKAIENL